MCDYSLAEFRSRLAEEGETLVVHRFPSGTKGLISAADWETVRKPTELIERVMEGFVPCAVCIPPGARLLLDEIPKPQQRYLGVAVEEEVSFTQTSAEPYQHRDALRFGRGQVVLLQELGVGQRVKVLRLSSEKAVKGSPEAAHQLPRQLIRE